MCIVEMDDKHATACQLMIGKYAVNCRRIEYMKSKSQLVTIVHLSLCGVFVRSEDVYFFGNNY